MAIQDIPKRRKRYLRERLIRAEQILKSPYRSLVAQDSLNYDFFKFSHPRLQMLEMGEKWGCFQIEDVRFYWPREYAQGGLSHLYKEVFVPAPSNPHAYETGDVQIHPGDWVVDAGACEGFFTHYALRRGAKVLAIEPVPRLAQALSLTFAKEIQAGDVRVLQAGIGPERGETNLTVPENEVYNASISSNGGVQIPVYRLDDLVSMGFAPKIDFLKMDIEGFELEVFEGGKELLSSATPRLSVAVYHGLDNARIVRSQILAVQPSYQVSWRGIFLQEKFGLARPYMLHAHV